MMTISMFSASLLLMGFPANVAYIMTSLIRCFNSWNPSFGCHCFFHCVLVLLDFDLVFVTEFSVEMQESVYEPAVGVSYENLLVLLSVLNWYWAKKTFGGTLVHVLVFLGVLLCHRSLILDHLILDGIDVCIWWVLAQSYWRCGVGSIAVDAPDSC